MGSPLQTQIAQRSGGRRRMNNPRYAQLMQAAEKAGSREEALKLIHAATAIRQEEATLGDRITGDGNDPHHIHRCSPRHQRSACTGPGRHR